MPGRAGHAVRLPHGGQLDDRIIALRPDGFQAHVVATLNRPFIVILVGENADHVGAALDLAIEPFLWVDRADFR